MRRFFIALLIGASLLAVPAQADAVTMKTARFVASFEGFFPCVYADPAGHATIGYGHLLHLGRPTKMDKRKWGCLTEAEAQKLLRKDLKAAENDLFARIKGARVTPSMITALTSFTFNLGPGALERRNRKRKLPATNIALNVRKGYYRRAGQQMLLYDGVITNGVRYELEGLQIRRRKENRLMIQGISELKRCKAKCSASGGVGV